MLSRPPAQRELAVLSQRYEGAVSVYRSRPAEARRLLNLGQTTDVSHLDQQQLAALTIVASMVLNLDEAITRQ